ncbi:unnamed protein product, partial [Brassica rapa subsp. trilocularis]
LQDLTELRELDNAREEEMGELIALDMRVTALEQKEMGELIALDMRVTALEEKEMGELIALDMRVTALEDAKNKMEALASLEASVVF